METPNPKPVKIGYRYGLILFVFGLVVVGINAAMIYISNSYFPKLFTVGIILTLFAPVFFIFPGGTLERMPPNNEMGKALVRNAPLLHKIIWIVWGIATIAIAVYLLISFDPNI